MVNSRRQKWVELPPQTSKALEAKHAQVVGQALAGVPLWEPGLQSRHPGVPYTVFPEKGEYAVGAYFQCL
ncbi:ketose-bisphosphate aldolase class-II family protein [Melia azedarach]|uniref:Ketose-bisphosphate aldolase class-II family protein n=1 Tax=Melia azedarach TaxID=155640 RepID=A0ACC1YIV8_MELAZ|nr:ketose-bisphosphate aldolase class-II family protein [Melia azedarach]